MISLLKSKFDTAPRRALFLSSDKLAVYHWDNGKLGSSYLFDFSPDGQVYFDRYLKESGNMTTYLMVDMVEEEYRQDTMPHATGSDRVSLLERKKSRQFRDTPYFYAEVQGREEEGRRDDQIMLMALTNPDLITPWIRLLESNKVPLAGIYSLPQITGTLLKQLPEPAENMLVVSMQSISGLRQTYFKNNKIKVSRLIDLPRYGTAPYSPIINDEVTNIHRYLDSLKLLEEDKILHIYYLCDYRLIDEIKKNPHQTDNVKNIYIDINEFSKKSGLDRNFTTPFSDPLFAYLLLKNKTLNFYAQKPETRYFKMQQAGRAMYIASLLLVFGSLIWGAINMINGVIYRQQSEIAAKKTAFYTDRYNLAMKKLPEIPVSPEDLKLAVNISNSINAYKNNPFDSLAVISQGLDRYNPIVLDEVEWSVSKDPNVKTSAPVTRKKNQGSVGTSKLDSKNSKYDYYQISVVNGHIDNFDGDYRHALDVINEFADSLRKEDSVFDVSILTLPLDISSTANLQGAADSGPGDARFSLRVILGKTHEQQ